MLEDVTLMLKYIAGWRGLGLSLENADINGDSKVTLTDVTVLMKYLAGWNVEIGETAEEHVHSYTSSVVEASCGKGGYTEYKCECGDTYRDNFTSPTYEHDFARTRKTTTEMSYDTYLCSKCGAEAFAHGNADGSVVGGNDHVKYYVTGKRTLEEDRDIEIIVYGTGEMPDFAQDCLPMWYEYLSRASKITVADGITTIGDYAFNDPSGSSEITLEMADSVRTVKANAIDLNMKTLSLGKGVRRVEGPISPKSLKAIFIPKSVNFFDSFSYEWNYDTVIYYEGTEDEFMNISRKRDRQTVTMRQYMDIFSEYNGDWTAYYLICFNSKELFDESHYPDAE